MSKEKVNHKAEALSHGFEQIPSVITTSSGLTASDKLILGKVLDMMWKDRKSGEYKNSCFPADEYLAYWCNVSERTIANCKKKPLVKKMFSFVRRWDNSDIWLFRGLPDEMVTEYERKVEEWEKRKPKSVVEIASDLEEQAEKGTLPEGVIRLEKSGRIAGTKFKENGKTFQEDGRKVQTNNTNGRIPIEAEEVKTKIISARSGTTSIDVVPTTAGGEENPINGSINYEDNHSVTLDANRPINLESTVAFNGHKNGFGQMGETSRKRGKIHFHKPVDDGIDYEALDFPKALELEDDELEVKYGDGDGLLWSEWAVPEQFKTLLPAYLEAHVKIFGVPYDLRDGELFCHNRQAKHSLDYGGPWGTQQYELDIADMPFYRKHMEGIMTCAATPVPDPWRWKCTDYSPSVIFNYGVLQRYKELLTLEGLPPFSIRRGLLDRSARRTRRQEKIWKWLLDHKDLPIWSFLKKGNNA